MPTKNRRARGRSKEELGAATGAKNRAGGGDATTKAKSVVSPTLFGACCAIVVIAALVACFLTGSDSRISPIDRIQGRSDADGVDEEAARMNMVPAGVGTSVREAGASFTLLPPVETQPGVHRFQVPVQPMRKPRYVVDVRAHILFFDTCMYGHGNCAHMCQHTRQQRAPYSLLPTRD